MSSNYPNGFLDGVTIRGVPLQQLHPGEVFWVNNSSVLAPVKSALAGSDGNNGSYKEPFSTYDYAIGKCKAGRGDIIVLMPGHAENVSTASGITSDVAGVATVGLGSGSLKPTFTFTAAAASHDITAANLSFYNIDYVANFIDVLAAHNVTADNITWEHVIWRDLIVNKNFLDVIVVTTGVNQLEWNHCHYYGIDAQNNSFFTGGIHVGFRMNDCYIASDVPQASVIGQVVSSGNVTDVWIKNSVFRSWVNGALQIDFNGTANSGIVQNCYFSSVDVAGAISTCLDFTGGHSYECWVAGEADAWGLNVATAYSD